MNNSDIIAYNQRQPDSLKETCELLASEISSHLPGATSKLFHANPVWFIDDNPIVGYDVASSHVNILFWSGQSFDEPGLRAAGKFKAAGTSYAAVEDVDLNKLQSWLKESALIQWNYRDLRENNGKLPKIDT